VIKEIGKANCLNLVVQEISDTFMTAFIEEARDRN
jgi:hypothetical protein